MTQRKTRIDMRHRNSINIDLTPLLDVILIILFLVLLTSHQQTGRAVAEAEQQAKQEVTKAEQEHQEQLEEKVGEIGDLQLELERIKAENKLLREFSQADDKQVVALDVLQEQSRVFRVEVPDEYPVKPLKLVDLQKGSSENYLDQLKLETALKQKLTSDDDVVFILILEYNNKKILLRDYRKINQSLLQLRAGLQRKILYREVDRANVTER